MEQGINFTLMDSIVLLIQALKKGINKHNKIWKNIRLKQE